MAEATTSSQGTTLPRPANEGHCGISRKDVNGNTPLHIAAKEGNTEVIPLLLKLGLPIEEVNNDGETALHIAASSGNVGAVKSLLGSGADVSAITSTGCSVWHIAAAAGRVDVIEALSERVHCNSLESKQVPEITPDVQQSNHSHPLVKKNTKPRSDKDSNVVKTNTWLPMSQNMSSEDRDYNVNNSNIGIKKENEKSKIKSNIKNNVFNSNLRFGDEYEEGIKKTDSSGILHSGDMSDMDRGFCQMFEELHKRIVRKIADKISTNNEELLRKDLRERMNKNSIRNVDLFHVDENGLTALHMAAACGAEDAVFRYLKKKPDVNAVGPEGMTPFLAAAESGSVKILKMLAKAGADVRAINDVGCTALHIAANLNHKSAVKTLLSFGLDPNAKTVRGHTPLHLAVLSNGTFDSVVALVEGGARVEEISDDGLTPIDVALVNGSIEVFHFLVNLTNPFML